VSARRTLQRMKVDAKTAITTVSYESARFRSSGRRTKRPLNFRFRISNCGFLKRATASATRGHGLLDSEIPFPKV
jgi:hypothetical protein